MKLITSNKALAITFSVKNTGAVAGAEVAQLYVSGLKSTINRPLKESKGLKKVFLQPGQRKMFMVNVDW